MSRRSKTESCNGSAVVEPVLMWKPDSKKWTHMDAFRNSINEKFDLKLENYAQLYRWSCDNYANFWEEFWHYGKIIHSEPYEQVVDENKKIYEIPEWFSGARLNYAENLLQNGRSEKVALYATGEGQQEIRTVTFGQLRTQVAQFAAAMRAMGVVSGDRVAGFLPNCVEAVVAMLAATSIGAIWSSTSPDFGTTGVLERFAQIHPKLLFSVAAVVYNGKRHDHHAKVVEVVNGLPELQRTVIVPFVDGDRRKYADLSAINNGIWLEDFLSLGTDRNFATPSLVFEQVPFSHPLFIMYSSGTTGAPKCMVHSVGGTLIQHLKEYILHGNTTERDVVFYYSTTGWMMWNWLVTALAVGASVVLYDGSPFASNFNVLWDLVDTLKITVFGTSAKWLSVMEDNESYPIKTHSLESMHTILSTGSPLKPQSYDYVYGQIKRDVILGSIAGGTDIIASFMGHNITLPVYRGEIQGPLLAMAIECWNDKGNPVLGERGELVCVKPHPSMPTNFWNDDDGIKYKKAYFSSIFRGVWCHGDFCLINPTTGGLVMLGRSDGTLNPNGVRFGSAEIYNIVESFEDVEDSLCVAQRKQNGEEERVILFIKMVVGCRFTVELVQKLQTTIRSRLSARHVPAVILETKDIPYTINGKKVEVAVRDIISGGEVKNRSALKNPDSLNLFNNIAQLNQS